MGSIQRQMSMIDYACRWHGLFFRCIMSGSWSQRASIKRYLSSVTELSKWTQPNGHETGIQIYHPLMKQKVPLVLQHDKLAHWYTCGPTVYDSAHIGHASSYIRIDIIRRILSKVFGINCILVMGITDIDDKIILKSAESGVDMGKLTRIYEAEFFADMASLNVLPPNITTRVQDFIPQIITFVKVLEEKEFAYKGDDGSVYFDVKKYGRYGQFAFQRDSQEGLASVKRNSQDFALWKASKAREPWWDSPWGRGRPGWHIECSAMASEIFGANFDIHSGGEDLMFPHHENEIAQSCAFHGNQQWANYWLHTGHLFVSGDSEKMSKSLKNVISIPDFLASYSPNHFRMLCLLNNYKKGIEFNEARMQKAVSVLSAITELIHRCTEYVQGQGDHKCIEEAVLYEKLLSTQQAVEKAFADDFNTPQALAHVMRLIKFVNQALNDSTKSPNHLASARSCAPIAAVGIYLQCLMDQLGLDFVIKYRSNESESQQQFNNVVDSVVEARSKIRSFAKDKQHFLKVTAEEGVPPDTAARLMKSLYKPLWEISDAVRHDVQAAANIQIKDTKDGSTWTVTESRIKEKKNEDSIAKEGKKIEIKGS